MQAGVDLVLLTGEKREDGIKRQIQLPNIRVELNFEVWRCEQSMLRPITLMVVTCKQISVTRTKSEDQ